MHPFLPEYSYDNKNPETNLTPTLMKNSSYLKFSWISCYNITNPLKTQLKRNEKDRLYIILIYQITNALQLKDYRNIGLSHVINRLSQKDLNNFPLRTRITQSYTILKNFPYDTDSVVYSKLTETVINQTDYTSDLDSTNKNIAHVIDQASPNQKSN